MTYEAQFELGCQRKQMGYSVRQTTKFQDSLYQSRIEHGTSNRLYQLYAMPAVSTCSAVEFGHGWGLF
jgi:hypothetical protein